MNEPPGGADEHPYGENDNAVVHVVSSDRQIFWEEEKNGCEDNVHDRHNVGNPCKPLRQDEGTVGWELAASLDAVDGNRHSVCDAQGNDGTAKSQCLHGESLRNGRTTYALVMALKALDDPRKTQPNIITMSIVKPRALTGTSSFLLIVPKKR